MGGAVPKGPAASPLVLLLPEEVRALGGGWPGGARRGRGISGAPGSSAL